MIDPIQFAREHKETHLAELIEFLRIPSVSTQPRHKADVIEAANWLAKKMKGAGLENVRVF